MSDPIKAICVKPHFWKYNYRALKASFTTNVQMDDKLKETPVALLCHEHHVHIFFPLRETSLQINIKRFWLITIILQ